MPRVAAVSTHLTSRTALFRALCIYMVLCGIGVRLRPARKVCLLAIGGSNMTERLDEAALPRPKSKGNGDITQTRRKRVSDGRLYFFHLHLHNRPLPTQVTRKRKLYFYETGDHGRESPAVNAFLSLSAKSGVDQSIRAPSAFLGRPSTTPTGALVF
ncbi:hypothetical protein B0H63DRAFT_514465 [Podospora didyma]|uniref:Uncharacterized protein n=1 Tax=Podospora didyma TaxID=330526 RepID=A0AAE0N4C8_9PEZI|nr:hypothetical protein B0H63DRAFT_514465 [Podospora didyma]